MTRQLFLIILLFLLPATANSATIHVPMDQPTIQDGIIAASNGDTVLVAPGTYVENISFWGKDITVKSSDGPEVTVIDGSQPLVPDYACVVFFYQSETSTAVLEGFTLTNGKGVSVGYPFDDYCGGGIYIEYGTCTIRNNIIKGNSVDHYNAGYGGGIFCNSYSGSPPSKVTPWIVDNVIEENVAVFGGGIHCATDSAPRIENNTIRNNETHYVSSTAGQGGGIHCYHATPEIVHNLITGNVSDYGGGICCNTMYDGMISGNVISFNEDGAIFYSNSDAPIVNNLIHGNHCTAIRGGGIYCSHNSNPEITNNTIVNNTCFDSGGGIYCRQAFPTVCNNILWGNSTSNKGYQLSLEYNSQLTISYSNVEGGKADVFVESGSVLTWNTGMLDAVPSFVDSANNDYHIDYNSPCRDAGDNASVLTTIDFEGDERSFNGVVDMGADEFAPHFYCMGDFSVGGSIEGKFIGVPDTWPLGLFVGSGVLDPPLQHNWGLFYLAEPWLLFPLVPVPTNGVLVISATIPSSPAGPYAIPMQALIWWELSNLFIVEVE